MNFPASTRTPAAPGRTSASPRVGVGAGRVARSLAQDGPATAAVLAARLGQTPAAVRRHLDALLADGLVLAADRAPFGPAAVATRGRGRPAKTFSLTGEGRRALDATDSGVAADALAFLSETAGDEAVREFARRRAARLEVAARERLAADPHADRIEVMVAVLNDHGYAAGSRPLAASDGHPVAPSATQLCQHHCPVADLAADFPQLCEAETEVIGRVLGSHVTRLATIARGDAICTTLVPAGAGFASPPSDRDDPAPRLAHARPTHRQNGSPS